MKLEHFVNGELKDFALYDIERSIPCIVDGLKPSQRKVLYTILNTTNKEIKVAQLASKAAEMTEYKHGEGSLQGTAVGLAQDFTGSNNLNLLEPIGQFGSILSSEAASPRYIYTKRSENLKVIFIEQDDSSLDYLIDEGVVIEPEYYLPILPLFLLNGAKGIGTGFAVNILNYNLKNIKKYINNRLLNKPTKNLIPHYNGYSGLVEKIGNQTTFTGKFERLNTTTISISELPIGYDVNGYKKVLIKLLENNNIKDFENNSTSDCFQFTIKATRDFVKQSDRKLFDALKLITKQSENITLLDENKSVIEFDTIEQSLDYFIEFRLNKYKDRIKNQLIDLRDRLSYLDNKAMFIAWWNNEQAPHKMTIDHIKQEIKKFGVNKKYFERLLAIKIASLSVTNTDKMTKEIVKLKSEIDWLLNITINDYYLQDLNSIGK